MRPATPTSMSVRSARFCPSACLPDGLFYSHPTRRVMRDASSFLPPQAVWAPPASRRGHLSPTTKFDFRHDRDIPQGVTACHANTPTPAP